MVPLTKSWPFYEILSDEIEWIIFLLVTQGNKMRRRRRRRRRREERTNERRKEQLSTVWMCTDAGHFTKQVTCTECGLSALRTSIHRERELHPNERIHLRAKSMSRKGTQNRTEHIERTHFSLSHCFFRFLSQSVTHILCFSSLVHFSKVRLKWHFAKFEVWIDFSNTIVTIPFFDIW